MERAFGFFNVDTQEPAADGSRLVFRPRVEPIAGRLSSLLRFAATNGFMTVHTTCVNASPVQPILGDEALFVPMDAGQEEWLARVEERRVFFLEKRSCGSPDVNVRLRAFDVFQSNANAARLLARLAIRDWVVFGDSACYCTCSTVRGLLNLGYSVTLLADAVNAGRDTEERKQEVLRELREAGAYMDTTDAFLERHQYR